MRCRCPRCAGVGERTAAEDSPGTVANLWATGFCAGLRRGELLALRWRDVDLAGSLIRVERGWDQYEGEQTPKTSTSVRTVPLLGVLRESLIEHKMRTGRVGNDLVFGRTSQHPFSPPPRINVRRALGSRWLEPITLHECRHTFASLLIDAGSNAMTVQTFMSHAKIQTTFDVYGHLFPEATTKSGSGWMPTSLLTPTPLLRGRTAWL